MKDPAKKGKPGINKDVFIFVFFLLLSFVFWYLNSLDKEVEAGIRYPVRYTNIPRGRTVNTKNTPRLNLFLKGQGSSVLRAKLSGNKTPLTIDISKVNYKRVPGSNDLEYFIITSSLSRSFTVQLRSEFEIITIKPDTLFFRLVKTNSSETSQALR